LLLLVEEPFKNPFGREYFTDRVVSSPT